MSKDTIVAETVTGFQSDVRPTIFRQGLRSPAVLVVFDIGSIHNARKRRAVRSLLEQRHSRCGAVQFTPGLVHARREHREKLDKRLHDAKNPAAETASGRGI